MPRDRDALFREKAGLVALFKAQISLLRESDPEGFGLHLDAIDLARYDTLLAQGSTARWPAGLLPGLRQGIRDLEQILLLAYGPKERSLVLERLRGEAGTALELLEAGDAIRLASIRRRGRIRNQNEYYLVRAAIDRLELATPSDTSLVAELQNLADRASVA